MAKAKESTTKDSTLLAVPDRSGSWRNIIKSDMEGGIAPVLHRPADAAG